MAIAVELLLQTIAINICCPETHLHNFGKEFTLNWSSCKYELLYNLTNKGNEKPLNSYKITENEHLFQCGSMKLCSQNGK